MDKLTKGEVLIMLKLITKEQKAVRDAGETTSVGRAYSLVLTRLWLKMADNQGLEQPDVL